MLLDFDAQGNLPPGIHTCTWTAFIQRFAWNAHRRTMTQGLQAALTLLHTCGCPTAWIDGSFTTSKDQPGDIDLCYDHTQTNLQQLRTLEPSLLDFSAARVKMRQKFSCECFPAALPASPNGLSFLEFFQTDRNQQPKGIVLIELITISQHP